MDKINNPKDSQNLQNLHDPQDLQKGSKTEYDLFERDLSAVKPAVNIKTIYLDAGVNTSIKSAVLGVILLFLCIFAVCIGLILCIAQSFTLEIDVVNTIWVLAAAILFFTLVYFLPSKIFTLIAVLIGAGGTAVYVLSNLSLITNAVMYVINLCLYRIEQAEYMIGGRIDYDLANTVNETTLGYLNILAGLAAILLAAIFSFLVYSRRNIVYSLIISVTIVFPGFFYGLIPGYFAFSMVAAFWVSQFTINMFESNYMEYKITKQNLIPGKKLEKQKLKTVKQQYKKDIKLLKSEIVRIARSPTRKENLLRLDRLVRDLDSISKNNRLFFMFYGLTDSRHFRKTQKPLKSETNRAAVQNQNIDGAIEIEIEAEAETDNEKPGKFMTPVQIEKLRIKNEAKSKKSARKSAVASAKKDFAGKPLAERLKIKFGNNLNTKKKYSVKGGYAGFFAFIVAFAAVSVVQPFISADAEWALSMPRNIMSFLNSTVEYALVGSDSSVYGGYAGGMGGGPLYRPEGAMFSYKPILKVTQANKSGVLYLKGWSGTIYTGSIWHEADKKQIEEYNKLGIDSPLPKFYFIPETSFYKMFTESLQNKVSAPQPRRQAELNPDKVTIEHLVSGGKRSFMPYFFNQYESYSSDSYTYKFRTNADLNIEFSNSLFRFPGYTVDFYTVDNVLARTPQAIENMRTYIDLYEAELNVLPDDMDIKEFLNLSDPDILKEIIPGVTFYRSLANINIDIFDRLSKEGEFYEYSAPSPEFTAAQYHGYVHIPHKYEEIMDIIKARYSIYYANGGSILGYFLTRDFVDSEVLYNNFVRKNYLWVPEDFPSEIAELALKITEGCESDYDKAIAVEKYIADNYTYTLTPKAPDDPKADFVYNFLFDMKEGYCTAYASSMVMMLRTLGIPARYAEGYLVDTSKREKDEYGEKYITVYDNNGHAWPEVYLRGVGWLPFEPTVSYDYTETAPAETPDSAYTPPPPRLPQEQTPVPTAPPEETPTFPKPDEIESDGEAEETSKPIEIPAIAWVILGIVLACAIIYMINRAVISNRFKNFKSAKANAAVVKMLDSILIFLGRCGFFMDNEEGLKEFFTRVSANFGTLSSSRWEEAAGTMQKARYSRHLISDYERNSVYDFINALRQDCLKELNFSLKLKLRFVYFLL